MVQPALRPALALTLAFAFSACGLIYQQILVYAIFDVSGNFVLSQSLGLGAFLLGMGLGAAGGAGGARRLAFVELGLSLVGAWSVFVVYAGEILLRYFYPAFNSENSALFFLPWVVLTGYLTGQEIPLLLRLAPRVPAARLLAASYFGGLLALTSVPILLLPVLGLAPAAMITSLVNFTLGAALAWRFALSNWMKALALVLAVSLIPLLKFERAFTAFHLKFIYFPVAFSDWDQAEKDFARYLTLDPPLRMRSHYQWLDLLPSGLSQQGGEESPLSLYLDRKLQLNELTQRRYHEALAVGGSLLLGRPPKRVLILGGGDGLLLPFVLQNSSLERVDLVELDGLVLRLAASNRELRDLNQSALADPRVHSVVGDGFSFLRETRESWDLILLDFPLPANYDLSLLYSREFYAYARARLVPDGILAMDFAWPDDSLEGLAVLGRTLTAAGFLRPFAYGQEDLFLAMARDGRELRFDFKTDAAGLSNQVILSLVSQQNLLEQALKKSVRVNSLFFPYKFHFDYSGSK